MPVVYYLHHAKCRPQSAWYRRGRGL